MNPLWKRLALVLVVFALVAAACGNDDDADDEAAVDDATETPTPEATPEAETATPEAETPTPEAEPVAPLTGLPVQDESILDRPALMVKIDNNPAARPQTGINQADMVLEILVEGGLSRLAFVFHSQGSDPVGPVRSERSSDPDLAAAFNRPLYSASGGNAFVEAQINEAEVQGKLVNVDSNRAPNDYFRDSSTGRVAPHNFYTNSEALYARAPGDAQPPLQIFEYREAGEAAPPTAEDAPGVTITFPSGERSDFVWDATTGTWLRWQDGVPSLDINGVQVAPANVVVLVTEYGVSAADAISPEAITVGTGEAFVLTDGKLVRAQWDRPDPFQPWLVTDAAGQPVKLGPGQTWLSFPGGTVTFLDEITADQLRATAP